MSPRAPSTIAAVALALGACTTPDAADPSEIVLFVSSDLRPPSQIQQLEIEVDGEDGIPNSVMTTLAGDMNGNGVWPRTLGVLPGRDANRAVTITARGVLGPATVITRQVLTRFVAGQRQLLWIPLESACGRIQCGVSPDCAATSCSAPPVVSLPAWDPETLAPASVAGATNLAGDASSIADDPRAPDDRWLTRIDASSGIAIDVDFPTPRAALRRGPFQQFHVLARAVGPGMHAPYLCLELRENDARIPGTDPTLGASISCQAVTSRDGQILSGYADASQLRDASGASLSLALSSYPATATADSVEIGAVQWVAVDEP